MGSPLRTCLNSGAARVVEAIWGAYLQMQECHKLPGTSGAEVVSVHQWPWVSMMKIWQRIDYLHQIVC
jgi:hypothetical protein